MLDSTTGLPVSDTNGSHPDLVAAALFAGRATVPAMPKVKDPASAPLTSGEVQYTNQSQAERNARAARAAREQPRAGTSPEQFQPQRSASRPQKGKGK